MVILNKSQLTDMIIGAAFLGSGGGGSLNSSLGFFNSLSDKFSVNLISGQDVADKQWGCVTAAIGAPPSATNQPTSASNNLMSLGVHNMHYLSPRFSQNTAQTLPTDLINKLIQPTNKLAQSLELGSEGLSFILAVETGAANILLPLLVAEKKGIPIVDGAGADRSVPQLNMTTYALTQIPPNPTALVNVKQQQTITTTSDDFQAEDNEIDILFNVANPILFDQIIRSISTVEKLKNTGFITAMFAMKGETLNGKTLNGKKPIIAGTLSKAQAIGQALREAQEQREDPVERILSLLNQSSDYSQQKSAFKLFQGRVTTIEQNNQPGFAVGLVTLTNDNSLVKVFYKNENLIAWQSDRTEPLAMGPDLICYLTPNGQPRTNADIQEGDELVIIGVKAAQELREKYIVQIFLNSYGYHGSYRPIEELNLSTT